MQKLSSKFCPVCRTQNHISAQFCQACGAQALMTIQATPGIQNQPKKQNGLGLLIVCGVVVFGCAGLTAIISAVRNNENLGSTSFATPTPLTPAEHLAAAKKLLAQPYSRDNYNEALLHLAAIPKGAPEYKEAVGMIQEIAERNSREEAANAPSPTPPLN
jgi:hypothetical protein